MINCNETKYGKAIILSLWLLIWQSVVYIAYGDRQCTRNRDLLVSRFVSSEASSIATTS